MAGEEMATVTGEGIGKIDSTGGNKVAVSYFQFFGKYITTIKVLVCELSRSYSSISNLKL
jgi:hypothetical protein